MNYKIELPQYIEKQVERFKQNFPDGEVLPLRRGRYALRFSVGELKIATVLPVGFPLAAPAHFYSSQPIGEFNGASNAEFLLPFPAYLHFIHAYDWNPNKHGINTWAQCIAMNIPAMKERCRRREPPAKRNEDYWISACLHIIVCQRQACVTCGTIIAEIDKEHPDVKAI